MVRGHSFHYSRLTNVGKVQTNYCVQYSLSGKEEEEGFGTRNVLASYIHLHFRAVPGAAKHLVQAARQAQAEQWVSA